MTLALFDFDGTISDRDSLRHFMRAISGGSVYALNCQLLSPVIIGYWLGLVKPQRTKEIILQMFIGRRSVEYLEERARTYGDEMLPKIVRKGAIDALKKHEAAGDRIIVVSASCELWLRHWCESQGIELLATRLEVVDGRVTGKIEGKNCSDEEKVARIKAHVNLEDYDRIIAYGDSSGDQAMFDIAHEVHYKPFRD